MSAHTPGPWTTDSHGAHSWDIYGANEYVARVVGSARHPNVEANARLIAAAPELLRLLSEVLRAGNANTRAARQLASKNLAIGFWEDVRAAIAKAEGR